MVIKTTFVLTMLLGFWSVGECQTKIDFQRHQFKLDGFLIILNADSSKHSEIKEAFKILDEKLSEITQIVKPRALAILQKVPIWVEWRMLPEGAMQYHKSRGWLLANGYNPDKVQCVEISNIINFIGWQKLNQPYMVLHELAHAFHDRASAEDKERIRMAYKMALESKKYDQVPYNLGGEKRAYALKNEDEYFAELSEAYFGTNDFYPYNRAELKNFDSVGYTLMQQMWE